MPNIIELEANVVLLLLVIVLVAVGVRRFKIPYTVALVAVGLLINLMHPLKVELTSSVILGLFIPPLVFEAAANLQWPVLRKNLWIVGLLAVPGVLLTAVVVAALVSWGARLSWPFALLFGTLIAATDPVAVIAIFRQLGLPARLTELIEGESLFNDGTSIVAYTLVLQIVLGGNQGLLGTLSEFVRVSAFGLVLGVLLGVLAAWLIARVDDYLIETTLTIVVAFGTYLLAEELGVSGVLAVVAAGLVIGYQSKRGMSPSTRLVLFRFWDHAAFLANSLIFLLIGLQVNVLALGTTWQPVLWGIAAMLVSRMLVVHGFGWPARLPRKWRHVMVWGGLRGAIGLALALSLPAALGSERETLRLMTFGVVVFTILFQATTIEGLSRRLRLVEPGWTDEELQRRRARLTSLEAAEVHLKHLRNNNLISRDALENIWPQLHSQLTSCDGALKDLLETNSNSLTDTELMQIRRELRRARLNALQQLLHAGELSELVYREVVLEVD